MITYSQAHELAEKYLSEALPRRWSHVQAVGQKAKNIAGFLPEDDQVVLEVSAILHDIGYSPELIDTGFHPLDGGRWLRRIGINERVVNLVAHHSCALLEAEERGLRGLLVDEFLDESSTVTDALWYCDMTTGPDGQTLNVSARLTEIKGRYGPNDLITRFIGKAENQLIEAVERTQNQIKS